MSGFISKDAILWNAWAAGMGRHAALFAELAPVLWGIAAATAGLTAFYMWRLVFTVFWSGPTRAPARVISHVHESPWSMTLPLVALAVLSVVGGAIGWPRALFGHDWIAEWLAPAVGSAPVTGEHLGTELGLMSASTAIALGGFALAWVLYARGIHPFTNRFASERPWRWLYERAYGKWHIDELYDAVVVRPIGWVSRVVFYEVVDRRVVDGLVGLVGWAARSLGFFGQLFQSGNIQRYLAIFAIGLAILLYGWLTPLEYVPESPPPVETAEAAP